MAWGRILVLGIGLITAIGVIAWQAYNISIMFFGWLILNIGKVKTGEDNWRHTNTKTFKKVELCISAEMKQQEYYPRSMDRPDAIISALRAKELPPLVPVAADVFQVSALSMEINAYFEGVPRGDKTTQEECVICLEDMALTQKLHVLPCAHTFHQSCIELWSRYDRTCPLCREPFAVD